MPEKRSIFMDFGQMLKKERNLRGLRQQDLALLMNVNRSTIAGYESSERQPDFQKLIWLSKYFDVCVDKLIGCGKKDCKCAFEPVIFIDDLSVEGQKKIYEYKALLVRAERELLK